MSGTVSQEKGALIRDRKGNELVCRVLVALAKEAIEYILHHIYNKAFQRIGERMRP